MVSFRNILMTAVFVGLFLQGARGQYYTSEGELQFRRGFSCDYIVLFTDDISTRRLRVFGSVVYDNLQFLKEDSVFGANYRLTFTLLDDKGEYISSERIDREIVTNDYYLTNSRTEFDWVEAEFDISAGTYKLLLDFLDIDSRATDRIEREVKAANFKKDEILIAGPILLDTVVVNNDGKVSLKPGVSGSVFDGDECVWVYYEVMSKEHPLELNISYHLIDSKGKERLTGDFKRELSSPVLRDKFRLNIDEFSFDDYQLVIQAKGGKKSASRSKKFRIHWPELPSTIRDLDKAIDQLVYIASDREITRLKEDYEGRRLEMFLDYWTKWGKTEAESFRMMEEYYLRIFEANQYFSEGGWRCDRGHVYILYGPPEEIDRHPYDLYSKAYEVWYYLQDNRRFYFVDEGGFGDYRLRSPLWQN